MSLTQERMQWFVKVWGCSAKIGTGQLEKCYYSTSLFPEVLDSETKGGKGLKQLSISSC